MNRRIYYRLGPMNAKGDLRGRAVCVRNFAAMCEGASRIYVAAGGYWVPFVNRWHTLRGLDHTIGVL